MKKNMFISSIVSAFSDIIMQKSQIPKGIHSPHALPFPSNPPFFRQFVSQQQSVGGIEITVLQRFGGNQSHRSRAKAINMQFWALALISTAIIKIDTESSLI